MSHERKGELIYLPREVLVHIFSFYVKTEGISSLINNLSPVSNLWKDASTDLKLYKVIDDPNLSKDMLLSLAEKLPHTYHLNLSYITTLTSENIKEILSHCSKLQTLHIEMKNSRKVVRPVNLLETLKQFCPRLENLNLYNYQITLSNCKSFLKTLGPHLKHLCLKKTFFMDFSLTMEKIALSCPLLEELDLRGVTGLDMTFPLEAFQTYCPKLKSLELENVEIPSTCDISVGFPNLEFFTFRVVSKSSIKSSLLNSILKHSTKLKSLDLKGNEELCSFTVESDCLETLHLSRTNISSYTLRQVLNRWKHSLKDLDLSMWHGEATLNFSLDELINDKEHSSKLEVLNLRGSPITSDTLNKILLKCPNLEYLNIESCPGLRRGIKHVYRTKRDVNILREHLLKSDGNNNSEIDLKLPRFSNNVCNMDKPQQSSDSDNNCEVELEKKKEKRRQSSDDEHTLVKKKKIVESV